MNDAASESAPTKTPTPAPDAAEYRVLARKYRPTTFDALIGQDVLVKTLTHALRAGRVAHAFMLTGVRGIGKTTTARIIARALNCVGPDGKGGPTDQPCGECEHCVAIAEDRHVDVIEMDAASHTGVDNIRDLNDSARYRPVSARYKIYIIDEIHMLSRPAFNALLKTLEEPPEHLKFVFATTEVRKVPITVLSRCQRFDLRRLDSVALAAHLGDIARREEVVIDEEALALLARAADGSVRDGLSLLDQAIAQAAGQDIGAALVRDMIGLADRARSLDLYETVMRGDAKGALGIAGDLYRAGADPLVILNDLLDITHGLTRRKLDAGAALEAGGDEERAGDLAGKLSMAVLNRAWQMLLKGVGEVQMAPDPLTALEMLLVRLSYVAELPTPGDLVRSIESGAVTESSAQGAPARVEAGTAPSGGGGRSAGQAAAARPAPEPEASLGRAPEKSARTASPDSFEAVVALFQERRELMLYTHLMNDVHPVRFEPGRIELRPAKGAPRNLANRVGELLSLWTGERWVVSVSGDEGAPTLAQQLENDQAERRDRAAGDPLVQAVFENFPGARIEAVRPLSPASGDIAGETEGDGPSPDDHTNQEPREDMP